MLSECKETTDFIAFTLRRQFAAKERVRLAMDERGRWGVHRGFLIESTNTKGF